MATVTIPGDFSLSAADMVYLDVPQLEEERAENTSKQNSGLYIIAENTHVHVTEGTFTKLSLAKRFIRKDWKTKQIQHSKPSISKLKWKA